MFDGLHVSAYKVPTDYPEADGTLSWDSTTMIVVEAEADGSKGLGYTYASSAAAAVVHDKLFPAIVDTGPMNTPGAWMAMQRAVRNDGRSGVCSCAIAAVDLALWDLKARLLGVPLVDLLGAAHAELPIYGSGGFTSYPVDRLQRQLAGWVEQGIQRVKMKIGQDPAQDIARVAAAREAVGSDTELFVDANGGYDRKQALQKARAFEDLNVTWFEEPVSSDDLEGLRLLRDHAPAGMEITAGEYGYDPFYFRLMLEAGAVDVMQPDATRCGGVTGFLAAAALCFAHHVPVSAHTAPAIHHQICCAVPGARHLEYFHDHVRIERMFLDGFPEPQNGTLRPSRAEPGLGLTFRSSDAAPYAL